MWRVPKEAMLAATSRRSARHSAGIWGASRRAAIAIARLVWSSLVSAMTPAQSRWMRPASCRISGRPASAATAGMSARCACRSISATRVSSISTTTARRPIWSSARQIRRPVSP